MKALAIYCAAKLGNESIYEQKTRELAKYLAAEKIDIVYGGAKVGIMGVLAETAMQNGANVYGVMPNFLVNREIANTNITQLFVTETMSQRKYKIMELADGFIALPGGFGTLEEIFEVLTLAQVNQHNKPIGIYNINNYYSPLLQFLENCVKTGLLSQNHFDLIVVDSDHKKLIAKMRNK